MRAASVGTGRGSHVGRRRSDCEPAGRQLVLDLELERERIAGLWMEDMPDHDAVWLALTRVPRDPAHEAVDRIRVLRLGQRKLVTPSVELVAPVLQAVGPRNQHLAPAGRRHLVDAVAVDDVAAVRRVRPEPTAHLDGDGALVPEGDLELLAGGIRHRYAARS